MPYLHFPYQNGNLKNESGQMVFQLDRVNCADSAFIIFKSDDSGPLGGGFHSHQDHLSRQGYQGHQSGIDKSLDLEKSREEMTPYFLARSRKLDFHFSFYSRFSRFLETISISLLDL